MADHPRAKEEITVRLMELVWLLIGPMCVYAGVPLSITSCHYVYRFWSLRCVSKPQVISEKLVVLSCFSEFLWLFILPVGLQQVFVVLQNLSSSSLPVLLIFSFCFPPLSLSLSFSLSLVFPSSLLTSSQFTECSNNHFFYVSTLKSCHVKP